jgi:hypothetical protein
MGNVQDSPEDQDSSTAFVRQRRDLFVISAFLLIAQIAELEPTKLSFLGLEVNVHNSAALIYALWALWLYWLLRYFQAFINLPEKIIKASFQAEVDKRIAESVKKREWEKMKRVVELSPEYAGAKVLPPKIQRFQDYASIASEEFNYGWNPQILLGLDPIPWAHVKVEITSRENLIANILATTSLCFRKIEVTEYLFPFIFGSFPALYFAYIHFLK